MRTAALVVLFLASCTSTTAAPPPSKPDTVTGTTGGFGSSTGVSETTSSLSPSGSSTGSNGSEDGGTFSNTSGSSGASTGTIGASSGTTGVAQQVYVPVAKEQDCDTIVQQFSVGPRQEFYPDGGSYSCTVSDGGYNCPFHDPDYVAEFDIPGFDPTAAMMLSIVMCDSACVDGTSGVDGTNTCALQQDFSCQNSTHQCQINGQQGNNNGELVLHSCRPATNYVLDQGKVQVDCGEGGNHFQHAYLKYLVQE